MNSLEAMRQAASQHSEDGLFPKGLCGSAKNWCSIHNENVAQLFVDKQFYARQNYDLDKIH